MRDRADGGVGLVEWHRVGSGKWGKEAPWAWVQRQ